MKLVNVSLMVLAVGIVAATCLSNPLPDPWCDWEGGETVLWMEGTGVPPIIVTNEATPFHITDPFHTGNFSLRLEDNSPSDTPHVDVAYIYGLSDGDIVTAGFWRYDTTPGAAPSCRIWGHWNDSLPGDPSANDGSASGNLDYGPGTGWDYTEFTWTVSGGHTGLVIEARTYSNAGDVNWIDSLQVYPPGSCTILTPCMQIVDNEETTFDAFKALYR